MSYNLQLTDEALDDIAKLPPTIRQFTLTQLKSLSESPAALSRPSYFPYWQKCQLFQFDCDLGVQRYELTVLFQYGHDEQTLIILAVGVLVRDLGDGANLDDLSGDA